MIWSSSAADIQFTSFAVLREPHLNDVPRKIFPDDHFCLIYPAVQALLIDDWTTKLDRLGPPSRSSRKQQTSPDLTNYIANNFIIYISINIPSNNIITFYYEFKTCNELNMNMDYRLKTDSVMVEMFCAGGLVIMNYSEYSENLYDDIFIVRAFLPHNVFSSLNNFTENDTFKIQNSLSDEIFMNIFNIIPMLYNEQILFNLRHTTHILLLKIELYLHIPQRLKIEIYKYYSST